MSAVLRAGPAVSACGQPVGNVIDVADLAVDALVAVSTAWESRAWMESQSLADFLEGSVADFLEGVPHGGVPQVMT
jgi:hypothetical protein